MQVGFMVVDSLARSAGIDMRKLEKSAAVGRGELRGRKVILAKPVTFMNNSGESVAALARFYKVGQQGGIPPAELPALLLHVTAVRGEHVFQ
jgi:peptidyl-tRNA hydrolase